MGWRTEVRFPARRIFHFATTFTSALDPIQLLIHWYGKFLIRGYSGRSMKLINHLHLVASLTMSGAVPPHHIYSFTA
jgi:hypothetical protein